MNTTQTTTSTPATTTTSSTADQLTYSLLGSGPVTDKTFAVAHFMMDKAELDFANWQPPIHIARVYGESKAGRKNQLPAANATPEQRQDSRRTTQRSRRNYPFHMEDASKKNVFNAYFEGDQSNRFDATCSYPKYVILKSTPEKPNTFRVIPCDDWYTFKREQTNPTLSLEEAEKIMKERMKGERKAEAETATATVTAAPVVPKVPKFMMIMKEEPQKETAIKQDFNATGDVEIEDDDEGLGNSWKIKKKGKKR
jgi:hypothetical protein